MTFGLRIFLGYFLIVGLGAYFMVNIFMTELKPGVRQSTEETLVDTANLLAELVKDEVKDGTIDAGRWKAAVDAYARRKVDARISGVVKEGINHRIYVTNERGTVIYDSDGKDVGRDYSRWNDVYLTLRGKYGARSTRQDPENELSSVMHVAAPVKDGERIIGVVTVGKPNLSVQPFIEMGRRKLARAAILLGLLSLAVGVGFSVWLSGSVRGLVTYARDLSAGRRVNAPRFRGELATLGEAMSQMRAELDGKSYVEDYVHSLTHELKSPLAAIRGAAELLDEQMPVAERARFLSNIRGEVDRLQQVIDRLLDLAMVERRQALEARVPVDLQAVTDELLDSKSWLVQARQLIVDNRAQKPVVVQGDLFLLRQALSNLLDNAIAFAPRGGTLRIEARAEPGRGLVRIHNSGSGIPAFAEGRLFERFYSLPRPDTDKKSTGLGLSFVKEVAALHGGEIRVENHPDEGVVATLSLPAAF
jgi:two-component system, OmpR family, sensor histidine kinase CreC